jgi:hypothetical protein
MQLQRETRAEWSLLRPKEAEVKTGSPNAQVDAPNDVSEVASMPAAPAPTDAAATSKTTPTRKGRELPSTESASPANAAA